MRIAVAALIDLDWGRTVRAVRINGLETPWCHGDIIDVVTGARSALDVLIVPKARSARDVWWVDVLLTQLEATLGLEKRIGLEVLIEESEGLANAVEIATVERPPRGDHLRRRRPVGLAARPVSTATSTRSLTTPATSGTSPASQVVTAARVAGIDAIDAPIPVLPGPRGLSPLRACTRACWASTASGRSTRIRS